MLHGMPDITVTVTVRECNVELLNEIAARDWRGNDERGRDQQASAMLDAAFAAERQRAKTAERPRTVRRSSVQRAA